MDIEYRKLSEKELDLFIEMRIKQLREEGAKEDFDLKPALRDYYVRQKLHNSTAFHGWVDKNAAWSTDLRTATFKNEYCWQIFWF